MIYESLRLLLRSGVMRECESTNYKSTNSYEKTRYETKN